MVQTMQTTYRKYEKRKIGHLGVGLILYELLMTAIVIGDLLLRQILLLIAQRTDLDPAPFEAFLRAFDDSYYSTILGVLAGLLLLKWFFQRELPFPSLFVRGKRMTPAAFFALLCVFAAGQLLFGVFSALLEYCLNMIGFSSASSIEAATGAGNSLSMILYAALIAPVTEELIYRGFVLRYAQQFGKTFAVVFSAALFGIMHANLPQAFFAFYVGLILGYVATEYSIHYAILLHFINNFVFGELLDVLLSFFPEEAYNMAYYLIFGMFTLCALIVVIVKRQTIRLFIAEGKAKKRTYLYAFTAVPVILFLLMNLVPALYYLDKL